MLFVVCCMLYVKLLTTFGTLELSCVDHVLIMVILNNIIIPCDSLSRATPGDADRTRQTRIEGARGEFNKLLFSTFISRASSYYDVNSSFYDTLPRC